MEKKQEINSHKDLIVWQEAMHLVLRIYDLTANFPAEEKYILASQMKRCAISIPSNIAEGFDRKGNKELLQFLYISLGSLSELETQTELATRLSFSTAPEEIFAKIRFIRISLSRLITSIRSKQETNNN